MAVDLRGIDGGNSDRLRHQARQLHAPRGWYSLAKATDRPMDYVDYGDSALNSSSQCLDVVRHVVSECNSTACIGSAKLRLQQYCRIGAPDTIRTCDLCLRSNLTCPTLENAKASDASLSYYNRSRI